MMKIFNALLQMASFQYLVINKFLFLFLQFILQKNILLKKGHETD